MEICDQHKEEIKTFSKEKLNEKIIEILNEIKELNRLMILNLRILEILFEEMDLRE